MVRSWHVSEADGKFCLSTKGNTADRESYMGLGGSFYMIIRESQGDLCISLELCILLKFREEHSFLKPYNLA